MEETLEGGRGPPRAVEPLEREIRQRKTTGAMKVHHKHTRANDRSINDLGSDASNKFCKLAEVWKYVEILPAFVREKSYFYSSRKNCTLRAFSGLSVVLYFPYSLEHNEAFDLSLVSFHLSAPPNAYVIRSYSIITDLHFHYLLILQD